MAYSPDTKLCLVHTVELKVHGTLDVTEQDLPKAIQAISQTVGAVAEHDWALENVTLPSANFNLVNAMPISPTWFSRPLVIQIVQSEKVDSLFLRSTTCLTNYDGVTALHTVFNVAEYLEHGKSKRPEEYLTLPAFKTANERVDFDETKMAAHVDNVSKQQAIFQHWTWEDVLADGLPPGPVRSCFEEQLQPREWRRFAQSQSSFKDFVAVASDIQERLKLTNVAVTVNFSPSVALAEVTTMQDVLDRQKRIEGIFTPVGAPLPMNLSHAEGLSYMLFWNNYGRHDPNLEILEVKGVSWNWTGLCKCFTPVLICTMVNGKNYFITSLAEPDHQKCKDLLAKIEGEMVFEECSQPLEDTVAGG